MIHVIPEVDVSMKEIFIYIPLKERGTLIRYSSEGKNCRQHEFDDSLEERATGIGVKLTKITTDDVNSMIRWRKEQQTSVLNLRKQP